MRIPDSTLQCQLMVLIMFLWISTPLLPFQRMLICQELYYAFLTMEKLHGMSNGGLVMHPIPNTSIAWAILLGNGSLEVWDVPLPYAMKSVCSSSNGEGTDPRFVKLKPHPFGSRVVALWKFSANGASDTRPLLCFSADTVTIRAITWVPSESDQGSPNLFLTAGHWGLKFCDIHDSFRPLWDLHPVPKLIYSLDWLPDPRCIILSFNDTMRRLSLAKAANDTAVNGQPSVGPKQLGMHFFNCSSFAIWSIQLSRLTGTLVLSFALVLK
ncbi:hypothetical protein NC652_015354 [Populus alba x Populus x berolinensis]|nr:hypothetical protein NC652_015354 [Populus alba x Populus x berolinensis]